MSIGHRLTILKSVYDIKIAQNIPIDSDHYNPLSANADGHQGLTPQTIPPLTPASKSLGINSNFSTSSTDQYRDRQLDPVSSAGDNGSAEIVGISMEDPCYKILPAALKKYNITAPWQQYALYIVYGDKERCLGLDEKPFMLFKQLDKEGKKPMFMLRKIQEDVQGMASLPQRVPKYNLPGGVL